MRRSLVIDAERFALAQPFVIARGSRTEAIVVTVTIAEGSCRGRGECVPYGRYGESVDGVLSQIETLRSEIEGGLTREALQGLLPAGAARNALDCALWDLDAKRLRTPVHELAGLAAPKPVTTAFTISLASPTAMADAAARVSDWPLLKLKMGGVGDAERISAVRAAAPAATLIVDANESWREDTLDLNFRACEQARVRLVEQPLPAGQDALLASRSRGIPICADESVHDRHGLADLRDRYELINIKLDKTGGLTEALALAQAARALGFEIFVGCMVGSSLAMAPALMLGAQARFVDLDGPLLLSQDREPGLQYDGSLIHPPAQALWG